MTCCFVADMGYGDQVVHPEALDPEFGMWKSVNITSQSLRGMPGKPASAASVSYAASSYGSKPTRLSQTKASGRTVPLSGPNVLNPAKWFIWINFGN